MSAIGKWAFGGITGAVVVGLVGCVGQEEAETEADTAAAPVVAFAGGARVGEGKMGHGPHGPIGHLPGRGRGGPTCGHAGYGAGGVPGGGPGGASGGGGTGGAPAPMLCTGTPPATPGITGPSSLVAATFVYSAPNLIAPTIEPIVATDGSFSGLAVTTPGATDRPGERLAGRRMVLPGCINTSAYTGVRFTIAGDLGTCSIGFVAVSNEKNADEFGGACTLDSCFSPASAHCQGSAPARSTSSTWSAAAPTARPIRPV